MQNGAEAHQNHAGVQDGVTDGMHNTLVPHRSQEAGDLSAEDEEHTRDHESAVHTEATEPRATPWWLWGHSVTSALWLQRLPRKHQLLDVTACVISTRLSEQLSP